MRSADSVQPYIHILNQVFDMEQKLARMENPPPLDRNLRRIKQEIESIGLIFHNPLGEIYDETRTDCEASISGTKTVGLKIREVIKPIVWQEVGGMQQIVQRAVVIVSGD